MKSIKNKFHSRQAFLYIFSITFERASYYGIRALIVIYMISETIDMDRHEALSIYGWLTSLIILSKIIGGIVGDLVIGNRKSIILGGIIQAIGAFTLCSPSIEGLYIGLSLIIIGAGLYTPNILSSYGKLYLNKIKLMDSAFAIGYLGVSLGAFLGILLIGYYGEEYGWNTGFITSGVLMLISVLFVLSINENKNNIETETNFTINQQAKNVLSTTLLVSLFWLTYELASVRLATVQMELGKFSGSILPENIWSSFQYIIIFPVLIVIILLWTYFYSSYQLKLLIGFISGAISYGIILYIPEVPSEQHLILYLISLGLLSLSEAHIAPIISSVVTKYSNPKYLAIIFGLIFIPPRIFSIMLGVFNKESYESPSIALTIALLTMIMISIGLIIYIVVTKRKVNI